MSLGTWALQGWSVIESCIAEADRLYIHSIPTGTISILNFSKLRFTLANLLQQPEDNSKTQAT